MVKGTVLRGKQNIFFYKKDKNGRGYNLFLIILECLLNAFLFY